MRDRENPEVIAYLEAENAYTALMTEHLVGAQKELYDEMLGRIQETDDTVPIADGPWLYYDRTEEGKPYPIHCRRKGEEGDEQVLLDENALAEGHEYLDVGDWAVSPNHNQLAYAVDFTGREVYAIHFLDLETSEPHADTIEGVSADFTWAADNETLFYGTLDDALRHHKIWRHTLGEDEDIEVYEETDNQYSVYVERSASDAYLYISSWSTLTTEYRLLKADDPKGDLRVFSEREQGHEYTLAHQGDRFLIRSNGGGATNFKVMSAGLDATDSGSWTDLIPHRDDVTVEGVSAFADFLVVEERDNGVVELNIVPNAGDAHRVDQPEGSFSVRLRDNEEYETDSIRFQYTSMVTPKSIVDYDVTSKERTLRKEEPVLGDFDKADYVTERIWATARDGVKVPMSVVKRADLGDGPHPAYLYAYGSYGAPMDPSFRSTRLSLLDRGFVFVIAHIRGGGDLGRGWYEDGKFFEKKNTFNDFIDCGSHLVDAGITTSDRLAIAGGSAGGLLIGAVVNMEPGLFDVAVADVPFVDVVTTMLDASIPLTADEWEEWGDPRQKDYFDYMLSYSPYDNVSTQMYPAMLITSGLNDPRVQYWEPTKWTARLRDRKSDDNILLLHTNMGGGHGGQSGLYGYIQDIAFEYAFVLDQLAAPDQEGE